MKIVRDPEPEERFVISHRPLNADERYPRLNVIGLGTKGLSLGPEGRTVLRGHVDRLVDGSILWTNLSALNMGNWLFSGFQLGGPGSASGVVGTWTASSHHVDDPCGPSWMWKVSGRQGSTTLRGLLHA